MALSPTRSAVSDALPNILNSTAPRVDKTKAVFHMFLDLPAELRLMVYASIFKAQKKLTSCRQWPRIDLFCRGHRRRNESMLPNICLIDHVTGKEATEFFLGTASFVSKDDLTYKPMENELVHIERICRRLEISLPNVVRKTMLFNVTGINHRCILNGELTAGLIEIAVNAQMRASKTLLSTYLNGLCQLSLEFYAPLHGQYSPLRFQALPIDDFAQGFDVRVVLRLKKLTRLVLIGKSGNSNEGEARILPGPCADDRIEHLYAVRDMARHIKQNFRAQAQDNMVISRLMYGNQCDEEVIA